MEPTRLILDCDGVILDYMSGFFAFAADAGVTPVLRPGDTRDYDLSDAFPGRSREEMLRLFTAFSEDAAFSRLPFVEGARDAILAMRDDPPLVVTSCGDSPAVRSRRLANLEGLGLRDVVFCPFAGSKSRVLSALGGGALYVDDVPMHAAEARAAGHDARLFRRPYNAGSDWDAVLADWDEVSDAARAALAGPLRAA